MDFPQRPSPKDGLRRFLRAKRAERSEPEREAAAKALAEQVSGWLEREDSPSGSGLVAAYLSSPPEPPTGVLLAALKKAGYDVVVPVCEPQYQLSWVHWEESVELARSPRAPLLEPVGDRLHFTALGPLRLVLVPGLGMDIHGNRLGQGGGYYDRFLAQLNAEAGETPVFGYLYEEEILPASSFKATVLDIPLGGAFTPTGLQLAK